MTHFIYLIDGTSLFAGQVSAGSTYSNIHHINAMLEYEDRFEQERQIVHYSRGLGSNNLYSSFLSTALAKGIWDDILDIYINICSNYRDGDLIYLFGYSRGAVISRAIAGMINIGLLFPHQISCAPLIKQAYLFYARKAMKLDLLEQDLEQLKRNKSVISANCHDKNIKVEFLGLFDSVVGGFRGSRHLQELNFIESFPSPNVKTALQLLAIDETLYLFHPSPFMRHNSLDTSTHIEQIWLPGTHSDIGGGRGDNKLADISLITMVDRILHHTKLSLNITKISDSCFKGKEKNILISSDYDRQPWKLLQRWRTKRAIRGTNHFVHPIVDSLSKIQIDYKGMIRSPYHVDRLARTHRCRSLISDTFANKEIVI